MTWDPPATPVPPPPPSTHQPRTSKRNQYLIVGGAVALIAAYVAVTVIEQGDSDSGGSDLYAAHYACAEFTRDQLKAPASADFPEYDDPGVIIGPQGAGHWRVSSYVDAENSFGASLRTEFVCEIRKDAAGDWSLVEWVER